MPSQNNNNGENMLNIALFTLEAQCQMFFINYLTLMAAIKTSAMD